MYIDLGTYMHICIYIFIYYIYAPLRMEVQAEYLMEGEGEVGGRGAQNEKAGGGY